MDKITKILLNYTSGKTTLEETNHALEDAGSNIRLNPAKNLFTPEELLARIRALSRRQGDVLLEDIHWADLTLKLSSRTLHCGAKSVSLGFKEFEVLKLLLANPNGIVSKEELLVKVWGSDSNSEDNNVEAYISFLRKKFFYLGSHAGIGTVRKVGYHLEEQI